jgi:dTDP-4-dehydrorhamnose reductase
MTRVLILGSNGLLGSHLYRLGRDKGLDIVGFSRTNSQFVDVSGDATDASWLESQLTDDKFDVVINAVKFKGSTDDCETRMEECWTANFRLPSFLARIQKKLGYLLVQISTDWVFEGKRGVVYNEASLPYPQNYYALSKFAGEIAVSSTAKNYLILRPTGLFGLEESPRNFLARLLETLKRNKQFPAAADQYSQPISALELSNLVYELLEKTVQNRIIMATGPDYMSRYQLAKLVATKFGYDNRLIKRTTTTKRTIKIPQYLRIDISEIERILGHRPKPVAQMIDDLRKV